MAGVPQASDPKTEPKGFGLRLMDEIQNEGTVHQDLVARIEAITSRNLISYSSFFQHPAGIIDDNDPPLIEMVLRSIDLTRYPDTLDLMLNSPGGSPTAAEKIVLTCRAYANSFRVIVPQSAMSAATMVAMGADAIVMTATSELGPIDPQMVVAGPGGPALRPAKSFIDAYSELVAKTQQAIATNQAPHPYIELLRKLDPAWIQVCVKARKLAEQIAEEFLRKWMLAGADEGVVRHVVTQFLTQGEEGSHGRAIRAEKARSFGLTRVETIGASDPLWELVWELHQRSHHFIQQRGLAKYLVTRNGSVNISARAIPLN
ncbi:MAG: hypothetical protein KDA32_02130 [Phycisphaerales bacterium]|nr:hypothetical protein [Phycisphaerales bacterium]